MVNGRLGNCLIPPYSGAEVYSNSSGSSASISISAQVLDQNVNSEITTVVGIASTTLSEITTVLSDGTFCNSSGFNVYDDTFCGVFQNVCTSRPKPSKFVSTGSVVTTSSDSYSSSSYGGNTITNPALGWDNPCYCICGFRKDETTFIGFIPFCNTYYPINKCHAPTIESAAQLFVNPCCNCGGGTGFSGNMMSICCTCCIPTSPGFAFDNNKLSDPNAWVHCRMQCNSCCCFFSCMLNTAALGSCLYNNCLTFYYIRMCRKQFSGCCCCLVRMCTCISTGISFIGSNNESCGYRCRVCIAGCCNQSVQYLTMSTYGVRDAMACGTFLHGYNFYNNKCSCYMIGAAFPFIYYCCNGCGNAYIRLMINRYEDTEFPVKYFEYNKNTGTIYMMTRSLNEDECGIFSTNPSNIYSTQISNPNNCCICTDLTGGLFTKVSDFPEIMTCSYYTTPIMCVSCLFKSQESLWTLSLYNTNNNKWDLFKTEDLVNWEKTKTLSYVPSETICYQVTNDCVCITKSCNCFMCNVDYSGLIDYKITANNYERTGVVVSNGDKVMVNNNSNKCMAVQVWGYEG